MEKIQLLYEMIIKGLELDDYNLKSNGFSNSEITLLLQNNILKLADNNKYMLSEIEGLYNYGVKLLFERNATKADICFKKCYDIAPQNRRVCLQLLLSALKRRNYYDAVMIFSIIDKINPEENIYDNNLYLYLLSQITGLPKEYNERLSNIDFIDISENYSDEEMKVRFSILHSKYTYAIKIINDIIRNKMVYSTEDELLKEMLAQALYIEKKFDADLLSLVKRKRYHLIISAIEGKMNKRYLTNDETYIYLLSKVILNLFETKLIVTPSIKNTDSIYDAIIGNNFKLAERLNYKFITKTNKTPEYDAVNLLLIEINRLVAFLSEAKPYRSSDDVFIEEPIVKKRIK